MTAAQKLKSATTTARAKSAGTPAATKTANATPRKKRARAEKTGNLRPAEPNLPIAQPVDSGFVTSIQAVGQIADVALQEMPEAAVDETDASKGIERIMLPARMELASLHEAHHLLQSRYPLVQPTCILDGALLSVIDTAGLEMLISFIRSVTARGTRVEWDNYSVQVYQLASELGVTSQLGD